MKVTGHEPERHLRRTIIGTVLALGGLVVAALLSVETGSIRVSANDSTDPIVVVQDISPFGIVFPGETLTDDFVVCIGDSAPGDQLNYSLTLSESPLVSGPGNFPDMRPFMDVVRDPSELDAVADTQTRATLEAGVDDCDRWLVTLTAPHCEGAYNPITDPQGSGVTIHCQVDKPTTDPQTWSEGSDLGAQVGIEVPAVAGAVTPTAMPATGGEPPVTP